MSVSLTRQDLQGALDYAKNRLVERLATKQELQAAVGSVKSYLSSTVAEVHQRETQWSRQALLQSGQALKQLSSIEARLTALETNLRVLSNLIVRLEEYNLGSPQI